MKEKLEIWGTINMQKQARAIFILSSALSKKLHLELTYRDPCRPAQINVTRKHPIHRELRPFSMDQTPKGFGDSHS